MTLFLLFWRDVLTSRRKPSLADYSLVVQTVFHMHTASGTAESDWIVPPLRHRQQMIQHTSSAATDSTRHQKLCNAIRTLHLRDRHCPRQGPFRQIYFAVAPKAEHPSPIRTDMRALRKLATWPLKPKRVTGLPSYYSGLQNLFAPVDLYSSECSGLSVSPTW